MGSVALPPYFEPKGGEIQNNAVFAGRNWFYAGNNSLIYRNFVN
jgi:ABC-type multidrug transport system permease subunit